MSASPPNPSSSLQSTRLLFVGAGNMAQAIVTGLLKEGFPADHIAAADPFDAAREAMAEKGVHALAPDAASLAESDDVIVLAVKPQLMRDVLTALAPAVGHNSLIISIAAGISVASLTQLLAGRGHVIRCMPNTPALVSQGASALFASPSVSDNQRAVAEAILGAVGLVTWVETESLLDAVTAVSGSGPAYFFAFMEAMVTHGVRMGLSETVARDLTLQTALGAATLALNEALPLAQLRENVTSPGGTTARAIAAFSDGDLQGLVGRAMDDCAARAAEMAEEFG
jgi:pyrroline-5-carboxylate reductase